MFQPKPFSLYADNITYMKLKYTKKSCLKLQI